MVYGYILRDRLWLQGLFTFRYHMDMGLGSYMGVDGPEFRPGNTYGHVETAGTSLMIGEHEWEVSAHTHTPAIACGLWAHSERSLVVAGPRL